MYRAAASTLTALGCAFAAGPSAPTSASAATRAVTPTTAPAAVARTPGGNYHLATPTRVVDTRSGQGAPRGTVDQGEVVKVKVTGVAGIPTTGVQAVVVNIGAVSAKSSGWLVAYPSGQARPATSTLNYRTGWTGSATATVPVGTDGTITLTVGAGSTDVLVDAVGWYSSATSSQTGGALLDPQDPYRLEDTRSNGGAIPAGGTKVEQFGFYDSAGSRLKAIAANVTAVAGSTTAGYLTTWSGTGTRPIVSTLQYARGEVSPNTTNIPVTYLGADAFGNSRYSFALTATGSGAVNVIVDVLGYYTTAADGVGTVYVPMAPQRVADTRTGLGVAKGKRGTNSTAQLLMPTALVTTARTKAFVGNLTGTGATKSTYQTIWSGTAPTDSSTTNIAPGRDRANGSIVLTPKSDDGARLRYSVFNRDASADFVVDMTGRFDTSPDQPAGASSSKRIVSHRSYLMPTAKGR